MTDVELLPCGVEHELRADAAIIRSWIDVANGPINREALADRLDRYANAAAELTAEIEALRAEVELWRHKAAIHKYRRKMLAEALQLAEEHIGALTPEWYSAGQRVLAEIRAALAEEDSND